MATDPKTGYFADGTRKIHYIIAVKEENLPLLEKFIKNLNNNGVHTEVVRGKLIYLHFILLHLPKKTQEQFSKLYNIGLEQENTKYADADILKGFHFKRLPHIPDKDKGEVTNATKIIILDKILRVTVYGNSNFEYGISKLKQDKIIVDSYPLHDGPLNLHFNQFNDDTIRTCNDRELLYRFWASFRVWHYEIPLDIIKKYYGHEIAFYFHWLEYFNLMLLPVAFLGFIVIISNIILLYTTEIHTVEDICNAENMYMCPTCAIKILCYYKPIKQYCELYTWTYVFDNYLTVLFAILISFWGYFYIFLATFFLNIWVRRTNELQLRWDVQCEDVDTSVRIKYAEKVKRMRLNNLTGEIEPCLSPFAKTLRGVFVIIVCIIMILFDILMIFAIFYFKLVLKIYIILSPLKFTKRDKQGTVLIAGCILLVLIIKLKSKIIPIVARWLTKIEMPKTQIEYDKTLMYKKYILSFCNNYTVLFYTAFVKGIFYGTPNSSMTTYIQKDTCQPLSCIINLASQVFFIMLFRRLLWNILRMMMSMLALPFKNFCTALKQSMPQYEEEYRLLPTTRDLLHDNYNEMIIEYGMVTFFGAAFPLAPLFALIDNLLEMRLSARRLIMQYRRPIPRIAAGIGPWEGVLLGLIFLSTAINAFVITFSTQFVSKEVFRHEHNFDLKGFINYTLSEFATRDYEVYDNIEERQEICFYMGMRESPESENKYQLTTEFWAIFTWKMVFLIVFEHIILMLNALLSFAIRDVPQIVKDHIAFDSQSVREARVKLTKEQEQTMFMRFRGRSNHN